MSIESSAAARRYFPHVNLLRGFAALSVVVYHIIEHFHWRDFPAHGLLLWFRIGWMSVDLFFVISGFVIGWSLIQLHHQHQQFLPLVREFLWRRLGRIVPLYALTLFVFAMVAQPSLLHLSLWKHWLLHLLFLHPLSPDTFGSINGINWSVGVEMHFYLFALVTSPWWVRRKPVSLFLIGVTVAWGLRFVAFQISQHYGLNTPQLHAIASQMPMMLDEFTAGMGLALLIDRYPPEKWSGSLSRQGMLLASAMLTSLWLSFYVYWLDPKYWHNPWMVVCWRSLIAISFMLVVAFCVWLPPLKNPPMAYRALYYLGDISYGIYLWHLTVILVLKERLHDQPLLALTVTVPTVLLLSAASWHWLEKPAIRWSKKRSSPSLRSA